jgi:hypothetical protein
MFSFFRRSGPRPVTEAISQAIKSQGLAPALGDAAQFRMVQSRGRYSDRQVTYFRIFDPAVAAQQSLNIQRYQDLDAVQNLVLRAGHIESDGNIVVVRPAGTRIAEATSRTRAGRTIPIVSPIDVGASASASPAAVNTAGSAPTV